MQLKRLEITGFKSFADKCAIDFPPGISAIVGPNGCGKSNIIDAIKWVMGEQSIKQLRGKSMGDVIFAGTDKRAPVNMAEVSLVVTGHDGNSPDPRGGYSEIMVTRRLYRSGESQYLLNRQPCRLRDINDIFLRYAMGSRSCAIIQQGNIGAITDAGAEERRAFIEEAAGVVRYKTRKQEAIAKVAATRENIARITDILEEIENRLDELSVEAEKARRYRDCRDQLKNIDTLVAVYYHEEYSRKIESLEALLNRLKEKTAYKIEEIESLHAALREIQEARSQKDEIISRKKAEKEQREKTTQKLEYERKHLENEAARIDEELARMARSLEETSEKNEKNDRELAGEYQRRETLLQQIGSVRSELEAEQESLSAYKEELSEKSRLLEEKKERLMSLSNDRAKHQNIHQNAARNKENLLQRLHRLETELEESRQHVSSLAEQKSETTRRMETLKTTLDDLKQEISITDNALKTKNSALAEKIKAIHALENDRSRLQSRLGLLKKMESGYEWYRDGVKAIMKNRANLEDSGRISGIAAEMIDAAAGYEHAVEAAMGEALQYIIVDDQDAGIDYIAYLRNQNAGRSGFIPAEMTPPAAAPSFSENESGQNSAGGKNGAPAPGDGSRPEMLADCVHVRPGFEALIQTMLSGVAVAADLNEARTLWQNGNGFAAIVTREGDVISSSGVLVGGSREPLAGILEKKREIIQVQDEVAGLVNTINSENMLRKEQEKEVKALENKLSARTQKRFKYDAQRQELEKTHYQATEKLKHAKRQLEIQELEKKRISGEKDDLIAEMDHHDQVLAELDHDIESENEAIENLAAGIETLRETLRTSDNRLVERKLSLTRLEADMDNTQRALARLEEFTREGKERLGKIRNSIENGEKRKEDAARRIDELESTLAGESAALGQVKQDLKDEESGYREIIGKQKETDNSITSAKSELENAREKIHKLELELSGLQINRDNVVNRFLERYPEPFSTVLERYRETVADAGFSIEKTEKERVGIRREMESIGDVNPGAIEAYDHQKSRRDFLGAQRKDLEDALADLENVIRKINRITRKLFTRTFDDINRRFGELFPRLFNGGSAWLELTRPDLPLETGVELMIQPPGKKLSRLSLLSGGEKALSAIAFIFSIFMINPASFCLLDEIDAPLDDANVHRFNELLRIIGESTQIIMVSHKKKTMEFSDMLFGITMAKNGCSRMISVNIDQALAIHGKRQGGDRNPEMENAARNMQ